MTECHAVRGLTDIHCHILPGIDDGPSHMTASVAMAQAAVDAGIVTIVATPHLREDFPGVRVEEIGARCLELELALAEADIKLQVVPGAEVSLRWAAEADDEQLRLASYGQHGAYMLVETPMSGGSMLPRLLESIRARGYVVVLAHPERLEEIRRDPFLLETLRAEGAIVQVNAESLQRRHSGIGAFTWDLCRRGLADVIASDGHGSGAWRPITLLSQVARRAERQCGESLGNRMLRSLPAALAFGDPLPPPVPQVPPRAWRWR